MTSVKTQTRRAEQFNDCPLFCDRQNVRVQRPRDLADDAEEIDGTAHGAEGAGGSRA